MANESGVATPSVRDVLIVYCEADDQWATWAKEALEDHGCAVRRSPCRADEENLNAMVANWLATADRCVLVVSDAFLHANSYTSAQWRAAIADCSADLPRLIPLVVDRARLPDSLPAAFREQIVDLSDIGERAARERLILAVANETPADRIPARTVSGGVRRRFPGEEPAVWCRWIPPRNPRFAGRGAELAKLRDLLSEAPDGAAVVALTGMGAVGKSEIAVEYVYRYRSEYDAIWFIRATRSAMARQDLLELDSELHFLTGEHELQAGLDVALQRLREDAAQRRWLVVIDDARTEEAIRPVLPNFTGPTGHVVITSAEGDWSDVAAGLPVEPMAEADCHDFLKPRLAECPLTDEETALLIEYCGRLPAAMVVASAHLRSTPQPLSSYLTQLRDRPLTTFSDTPARYPQPLMQTFLVALDGVTGSSPAAGQLLRLLSFMASAPVPVRLFEGLGALEQHTGIAELTQAMARPEDGTALRAVLEEIRLRYMAKIHRLDDELTIEMHRVPQGVIAGSIPEPQAELYRHTVHLLLREHDLNLARDVQQWQTMRDIWRNLEAAKAWSCVRCAADASSRELILHVIRALMSWRESEQCRISAEQVLSTWTPILGADHTDVRTATLDLANALRNEGKAAESLILDQALRSSLERTPDSRPETAIRAGLNLGGDLRRLGRYTEALEADLQTRDLALSAFDSEHRLAEMARNNVAVSYLLLGEPTTALASDVELLRDRQKNRREADRATFTTLTRIALANSELGRYGDALQMQERTAYRARKLFGPDNMATVNAELLLAACQRKSGLYEDARQLAQSAAGRIEKLLGPKHPEAAMAQTELANCQRCTGRLEDARDSGRRALDVSTAANGPKHPATAICMNNLATVHLAAGRPAEARTLLSAAAGILDKQFPHEHRHPLVVRANMATALWLQGDFVEANRIETLLVPAIQGCLQADHPVSTACAANWATTYDAYGSTALQVKANSISANAIGSYSRVLGINHPETQIAIARKDRVVIALDAVSV